MFVLGLVLLIVGLVLRHRSSAPPGLPPGGPAGWTPPSGWSDPPGGR
jgi:hypothetical protein